MATRKYYDGMIAWILKTVFDSRAPGDKALRSRLRQLLRSTYEKFPKRIDTLLSDDVATARPKLLALLISGIAIDELESRRVAVGADKRRRVLRRVTRLLKKSPEVAHAILRVSSHRPDSGDAETSNAFFDSFMREETGAMPLTIDQLGDFDFDISRLPKKFADEQYRKTYLESVLAALKKIGRDDENDLVFAAATIGLMLLENHFDPEASNFFEVVNRFHTELVGSADPTHKEKINNADVRIPDGDDQRIDIYTKVFTALKGRGIAPIFYQDFARMGRRASDKYTAFKENGFKGFENNVVSAYTINAANGGFGGQGGGHIALPPLSGSAGGGDEIEPENIRTVAAIYVGYQLENIGVIQSCNRMVEIFMAGLMPLGNDEGARKLDNFYWDSDDFLTDAARAALFSRTLGASGGQISQEINPNTEFNTLLLRFVSSVAEYYRNQSISNLFQQNAGPRPLAISGEYVRKAGRDLAANVSLYGWAGTHFASERLSLQLGRAMEILQLPQILDTYGVNNMWQVLERFNQREFGRNVNTVKHRTLAEETRRMLNILADNHTVWSLAGDKELFSDRQREIAGDLSIEDTEQLYRSVQYWLAVNGIQDTQVDQYSQPIETVMAPSLPGLGGNGAAPNTAGIEQIRQMASQGIAPTPEQILALTGRG